MQLLLLQLIAFMDEQIQKIRCATPFPTQHVIVSSGRLIVHSGAGATPRRATSAFLLVRALLKEQPGDCFPLLLVLLLLAMLYSCRVSRRQFYSIKNI
jgi:hypothetical protein